MFIVCSSINHYYSTPLLFCVSEIKMSYLSASCNILKIRKNLTTLLLRELVKILIIFKYFVLILLFDCALINMFVYKCLMYVPKPNE